MDPISCKLQIQIIAHIPDRRKRDLDNILKALLDSLKHGKIIKDDYQIDNLNLIRGDVKKGGEVVLKLSEILSYG